MWRGRDVGCGEAAAQNRRIRPAWVFTKPALAGETATRSRCSYVGDVIRGGLGSPVDAKIFVFNLIPDSYYISVNTLNKVR